MSLKIPYAIRIDNNKVYSPWEALKCERNENLEYKCPCCNQKLILRNGEIRIPHFAHISESYCEKNEKEAFLVSSMYKIKSLFLQNNSIDIPISESNSSIEFFTYTDVQYDLKLGKTALYLSDEYDNRVIINFKIPSTAGRYYEPDFVESNDWYVEIDLCNLDSDEERLSYSFLEEPFPDSSLLLDNIFMNPNHKTFKKSKSRIKWEELNKKYVEILSSFYQESLRKNTCEYFGFEGGDESLLKKLIEDYAYSIDTSILKLSSDLSITFFEEKFSNIWEKFVLEGLHDVVRKCFVADSALISNILAFIFSDNERAIEILLLKYLYRYDLLYSFRENAVRNIIKRNFNKLFKDLLYIKNRVHENIYNMENNLCGEISFYQCMNYIDILPHDTKNIDIDFRNDERVEQVRTQLEETLELKLIDGLKDNSIKIEFPELNNCKPRNTVFINCFLFQFEQIYNILQEESSKVFLKSYVESGLNDLLISKGFDDSHRTEIKEILDKYEIVCKDF